MNSGDKNIIAQPLNRNTFPAMLLTMQRIVLEDPFAVVAVCAADHWIEDRVAFRKDVEVALGGVLRTGGLFTFGVEPDFPETGYGYIKAPDLLHDQPYSNVMEFVEKPSLDVAKGYVDSGDYYWNSGIFVWSAMSFLGAAYSYSNEMMLASARVMSDARLSEPLKQESMLRFLEITDPVSVDVAVMQRAAREHKVFVRRMSSRWSDVGTWPSVMKLYGQGVISPSPAVESVLNLHIQ